MALLVRSQGWIALVGGAACVLAMASGCGSSSGKKATRPVGDAGAAGETSSAGAAGTSLPSDAGAAPSAGAAGEAVSAEGGASSEGGATAEGGAAGAEPEPFVCEPSGATPYVQIQNEGPPSVCRNSVAFGYYYSQESSPTFTCCGTSDAETPFGVQLNAIAAGTNGNGYIQFVVPADAPLGAQKVTVSCLDSNAENDFDIDVKEGTAPVVTSAGADTISFNAQGLTLTGTHLAQVIRVFLQPTDGGSLQTCYVGGEPTDTSISCTFDGLSAGEYRVIAYTDVCGAAVNQPHLSVKETF